MAMVFQLGGNGPITVYEVHHVRKSGFSETHLPENVDGRHPSSQVLGLCS